MANYGTLQKGSSNTEENKILQQKLKDAGYGSYLGSAGVDGVFGDGTDAGVRAYQSDKDLQVDGIVGPKTWESLLGGSGAGSQQTQQQTPPVAAETAKSYRYDHKNDPVYQAAQQKVTEQEGSRPTMQGTYDQQVEQLFQEVMGQKDFQYDLNGDALWQQYKDQYTTQGKLAMMDTMGQAAALTGGYGSSYAQGVGQQAYQGYLQQLNDRVPELYQLALEKYNSDQAALKDKFATAKGMQDDEYGKYQDAISDYYTQLGIAREDADTAYDRGQSAWYTGEQLRRDDENTAYNKQQNARSELMSMIASTGYTPSDAELAAAGMTRGQATALATQYEWEKGAEDRAQNRSTAASRAEMLAAGGDYSALASLYGMTEEQVAAYYAAQNTPEYVVPNEEQEQELRDMFLNCTTPEEVENVLQYAGNRNYDPGIVDAIYTWYQGNGHFDF